MLNDALGLHTTSLIVKVSKLSGSLEVDRFQQVLTSSNLFLNGLLIFRKISHFNFIVKELKLGVKTVHNLELIRHAELDLSDTSGLEDTTTRVGIGVHFHLLGIDSRVDHHPRSSTKLAMWWKVNVDRVGALTKSIDNHGTKLENLASHVATSSAESSPVGKDHDWKTFLLKVTNGLSSLVRRIGEQHLTCLGLNRLARVGISRIGRNHTVDQTSFDGNGTHWDTSETTTSDNDTLTPTSEVFLVTSLIEESRHVLRTGKHETRIVWSRGRTPFNITVNRIGTLAACWNSTDFLGNETEPFENLRYTLLIIIDLEVRHTVGDHNLRTTELILRGVHLLSEQLVQGGITSQDNRSLLHLDNTLSETDKVGSDSNTTSSNVTESKDLVVSLGSLASNLSTSLKILDTNTVFSSNHIVKSPAIIDLVSNNSSLRECLVVFIGKVQVVEAL